MTFVAAAQRDLACSRTGMLQSGDTTLLPSRQRGTCPACRINPCVHVTPVAAPVPLGSEREEQDFDIKTIGQTPLCKWGLLTCCMCACVVRVLCVCVWLLSAG